MTYYCALNMTMILYTTVGVSDLERSIAFYDAVFSVLGYARSPDWAKGWAGWGPIYDEGVSFWICKPFDGKAPGPGNGAMIAFRARNEGEVEAFHAQRSPTAAATRAGRERGSTTSPPSTSPTCVIPTATSSPASITATMGSAELRTYRVRERGHTLPA